MCVVGGTAAQAVSHLMVLQFDSARACSHKDRASYLWRNGGLFGTLFFTGVVSGRCYHPTICLTQ